MTLCAMKGVVCSDKPTENSHFVSSHWFVFTACDKCVLQAPSSPAECLKHRQSLKKAD